MKKYTIIMVIALGLGFLVGMYLYKINYKKNDNQEIELAQKVEDECTDFAELEANGTLRFRPHVIAGIIFIYMFYVLEQYANGLITADWKFYFRFIIASIILMWFHSTMWIMFIVVFLPYIFNFSNISHMLKI